MTNFQFACYMLAVILIVAMAFASGIYLVITEHYGWAWIPFLIPFCIQVNYLFESKKDKE